MEIVLYYAPITCALAPYITLTEADAKFEVRPLNFKKGQHTRLITSSSTPSTKCRSNSSTVNH